MGRVVLGCSNWEKNWMLREAGAEASPLSRGLGVRGWQVFPLSSRLMHRRPGANFSRYIPKQHPRSAASGREKERMDWMDAHERRPVGNTAESRPRLPGF